ncbi:MULTISPECIES: hypothetical protein [unclassified Aeromicrobium]|uniref:hypothetical protein n=1 Tax=unclassified Aeromicrobium TaxID=2633570 RepID=UPI002889FFE3|nr:MULTISPECIES: hypothetical protein [unclassified Aeromicrobium]
MSQYRASELRTTLAVLGDRAAETAAEVQAELDEVTTHLEALSAFRERMKFGSAMPHHPGAVMTWLIEQGWTPPPGVLLLDYPDEVEPDESMEDTA